MDLYTVTELQAEVPVSEYVTACVDVEKFLGFCRECPNYGKIWACPPLTVNPMEIWKQYDRLQLHARILRPEPGLSLEELLQAFREEKIRLSKQVLDMEPDFPGSRSMAASTCVACSPCARAEGKPCRHPEQVRYSIEALGGDVGLTMEKYLHTPLQWIQADRLPEYLTLVAGLLVKDPEPSPEGTGEKSENPAPL